MRTDFFLFLFFLFFFQTSFSIRGTALYLFRLTVLSSQLRDNEAKGVNLGHHSRHTTYWVMVGVGLR
ncbi:hypothetical protein ACN38_g8598 [Penicillium nordicum]|uniref:Uncharacterized protein n=1 Tax=Penicillium nordicum TaxID=229535 RepID=A0A0N0RY91_9EURO|nr:hypothetical protein ACN38_g8598 [Penicillium nordicum]